MGFAFWRKSERDIDAEAVPSVVLVSADPVLPEVVRPALAPGWSLLPAAGMEDARREIGAHHAALALYDRDLPGIPWKTAVAELSGGPDRVCVIVLSGTADRNLWDEVGAAGGYEVLAKPVRPERLAVVLRSAWNYWRAQHALRRDARDRH